MQTSITTAVATAAAEQLVDITAFDIVGDCQAGHSFELRSPDGTGTGIHLRVLGSFAPDVVAHSSAVTERLINEQRTAQRKGKPTKAPTMDELKAQNIEGAVVRVTGWSGVRQAFTKDLLRAALQRNPHWISQITDESENLGNFGTTSEPNSGDTSAS